VRFQLHTQACPGWFTFFTPGVPSFSRFGFRCAIQTLKCSIIYIFFFFFFSLCYIISLCYENALRALFPSAHAHPMRKNSTTQGRLQYVIQNKQFTRVRRVYTTPPSSPLTSLHNRERRDRESIHDYSTLRESTQRECRERESICTLSAKTHCTLQATFQ
jgi:hypothetical protein